MIAIINTTTHDDLWKLAAAVGFDETQFITGEREGRKVLLLPKTEIVAMLERFEALAVEQGLILNPYNDDFHYWGFFTGPQQVEAQKIDYLDGNIFYAYYDGEQIATVNDGTILWEDQDEPWRGAVNEVRAAVEATR